MRCLFCTMGSHGYVYPAIGIARVLCNRGWAPAFATDQPFASVLQQEGFQRIPFGDRDSVSFQVANWFTQPSLLSQINHTRYAIRKYQPDAVIASHLALGSLAALAAERIPSAVIGFATFLFPHCTESLQRPATKRAHDQVWRYKEFGKVYRTACEQLGVPPPDRDLETIETSPLIGNAHLLQSVPLFFERLPPLPPQVHLVGSCVWEPDRPDRELAAWLSSYQPDTPVLYVQHSRSFGSDSFWPYLLEALKNGTVRVVAATSRMDKPIGKAPDNFFVRFHVPQGQVLPHASGVICNATTTAVLGAITHGLPCMLVPGGSGQAEIAEDWVRAGIGFALSAKELSVAALHDGVERLLQDEGMRRRSCELQKAFADVQPHARAADAVQSLIGSRV